MNILLAIINTLVVILALLLIALVLVQPSKSGGFGSAFGGLGESVFGAHALGHLSKLTVICITLFFVLTLLAAIVSGHMRETDESAVMDSVVLQDESIVTENGTIVTENGTIVTENAVPAATDKTEQK